jgi:hypothetical protein
MQAVFDLLGELWGFMRTRKSYWLAPLIICIFLMTLLLIFAQSAAAPFIYSFW